MANQVDGGKQNQGAIGGIDQEQQTLREKMRAERKASAGGRDDRLDEELEQQRREPGMNTAGDGGAGADPSQAKGGNSNT